MRREGTGHRLPVLKCPVSVGGASLRALLLAPLQRGPGFGREEGRPPHSPPALRPRDSAHRAFGAVDGRGGPRPAPQGLNCHSPTVSFSEIEAEGTKVGCGRGRVTTLGKSLYPDRVQSSAKSVSRSPVHWYSSTGRGGGTDGAEPRAVAPCGHRGAAEAAGRRPRRRPAPRSRAHPQPPRRQGPFSRADILTAI